MKKSTKRTLLAALMTQRAPRPWLAPLPPVLCNAVLIGGMLTWYEVGFTEAFLPLFGFNALWVGLGEAAVCYLLGGLFLRAVSRVSPLGKYIPAARGGQKE